MEIMAKFRMNMLALAGLSLLAACGETAEESPDVDVAAAGEEASPGPASRDEDIDHYLLQEYPDAGEIKYALAWSDLNGDGSEEAIVYPIGPWFCGSGGCNTLVLSPAGPMYEKVGEISVSRTPVSVLESSTNGWQDLTVEISGGGGPSGAVVLTFDGEGYTSNASTAPAAPADAKATELIAEEPEMRTATPEAAPEA